MAAMSEMHDTQPQPAVKGAKQKTARWISALGLVLLLALGVFGGYEAGLADRRAAQTTVIAQQLDEQFRLGVQAMEAGQYEIALQHFQFVVQKNPNYPGIQEKYTELLLHMSMSPTPTLTPSPTLTLTPDLRGAEALYAHAQQLLNAQDWTGALETLDSLRKADPTYRVVEVDGMYYIALYKRGISKIFASNCQDINLEGGIYDLTLAERFGPLGSYADGLRSFARLYIIGASFWEIDWVQAQYYFSQVYPHQPNLMDASCKNATDRYRIATIKYADQLLADKKWCDAYQQYHIALQIPSGENAAVVPTATYAAQKCYPPTRTPLPVTETPTPSETPTETPTVVDG